MTRRAPTVLYVCALLAAASGCSPGPTASDAGAHDAGLDAGDAGAVDAGEVDAGEVDAGLTATMSLFQTRGMLAGSPVTLLQAFVVVTGRRTHGYDDGVCTADHYDAAHPAPRDADAAWLRIAGYAGGVLLDATEAAQPVVCIANGAYACQLPSGVAVTGPPFAAFAATAEPLGPGPVLFATGGGSQFGAASVTASPSGGLTVREQLSTVQWQSSSTLHVDCPDGCPQSRVALELFAVGASPASFGVVSCVFPYSPTLTVPPAAIAQMLGADPGLDAVWATVARIAATPSDADDRRGNRLEGRTGLGAFGLAPR